jgi:GNAT superfamily N-acetyltransferase
VTRDRRLTSAACRDLLPAIAAELGGYPYDHFRRYPARAAQDRGAPWESYLLTRLNRMADDPEWTFFGGAGPPALLLGARTARWDLEQFGIPISSLAALYCPDQADLHARMDALLQECLAELRSAGVRFVSARVNGDQLDVLHALEEAGFRYYETVVWPVVATGAITAPADCGVRLLAESELPRAAQIAAAHGFARTHFLCDPRFDRERVEAMHSRWITTAWQAGDPIAVVEAEGEIAGVFALRMDAELSAGLGCSYGRMRYLAVDASHRGRGLGKALFEGSMRLLAQMGADYIDSGYPSKNHRSARLHVDTGFHPVHEEATFHLWL